MVMVFLPGCKDETTPVTPTSEHLEPEGWLIRDETSRPILVVWQGIIQASWEGITTEDTLIAPVDSLSGHLTIKLLDSDKKVIVQPTSTDYSLVFSVSDTSVISIFRDDPQEWAFHLQGKKSGVTNFEIQLFHLGHIDVRTPKIPVEAKNLSSTGQNSESKKYFHK